MADHSVAYVALDTSKLRHAVAVAAAGCDGEVRYLGEVDNTPSATGELVRKLAKQHAAVTFCYGAGPAGYGHTSNSASLSKRCCTRCARPASASNGWSRRSGRRRQTGRSRPQQPR